VAELLLCLFELLVVCATGCFSPTSGLLFVFCLCRLGGIDFWPFMLWYGFINPKGYGSFNLKGYGSFNPKGFGY
jgi:hypothetical protein